MRGSFHSVSLTATALALCAGLSGQSLSRPLKLGAPQARKAEQAFQHLTSLRLLGDKGSFQLRTLVEDAQGGTHYRYSQFHRGVRVWGGEAVVHEDAQAQFTEPTLDLRTDIQLDVQPTLSAQEALAQVDRMVAPKGAYNGTPQVELVVVPQFETVISRFLTKEGEVPNAVEAQRSLRGHVLAYHVHVELENDLDGVDHQDMLVDAHSGKILKQWSSLRTDSPATGTGKSLWSGNVVLSTRSKTAGGFELADISRPTKAHPITALQGNLVTDLAGGTTGNGTVFSDADNTWGDGANYSGSGSTSDNGQTAAVDAAYGFQSTWDYFKNVHGRNGIDGQGSAGYSRVHYSANYANAFWSDACFCMTYGDGTGGKPLTTLDISGHEVSHGVMANTADLVYSDESGGLNEANSDIHGALVEFYAKGGGTGNTVPNTGANWTMGEDLGKPLRYMDKPSLDKSSPDAWSPSLGSLNVHYSSGPMNRAFYFLAQGASPTNSNPNAASTYLPTGMTGLGNDKAAKIWYRAQSVYLTPLSNYVDARMAALRAAKDLYGATEIAAVQNAFAGINVGLTAAQSSDTTAPTVSATVGGTAPDLQFQATATDNTAVTLVEYWLEYDGATAGTGTFQGTRFATATAAPWTVPVNSRKLPNGNYRVVAKAFDAAGNIAFSTPVPFALTNSSQDGLLNGNFESGAYYWSSDLNYNNKWYGAEFLHYGNAHTGDYCARLGSFSVSPILQELAQGTLTLPSTNNGLTYTFWVHSGISGTGGALSDNLQAIVWDDKWNATLATLGTVTFAEASGGWVQRSYTIPSNLLGKTVYIGFVMNAATPGAWFDVDDVSLALPSVTASKDLYKADPAAGDVLDMAVLAKAMGKISTDADWATYKACDLNGDGAVDEADVQLFLNGF